MALAETGLSIAALADIAGNSIEACFAPEADKAAMHTELDQWKTEYSDLLK